MLWGDATEQSLQPRARAHAAFSIGSIRCIRTTSPTDLVRPPRAAWEPVYADAVPLPGASIPVPSGAVAIGPVSQRLVGIRVAAAEKTSGTHSVRFLGRVVPEDTRTYRINAGMDGFVRETFDDRVGEFVKKDQKLATSYVAETLSVASGFLAAS